VLQGCIATHTFQNACSSSSIETKVIISKTQACNRLVATNQLTQEEFSRLDIIEAIMRKIKTRTLFR
jgi:hypothetical protein